MRAVVVLVVALTSVAAACKEKPAAPEGAVSASEVADYYLTRCSGCHGSTGAGDGSASASLTPKPRSFRDTSWQSAVDDAAIRQVILKGGQAGGKSVLMPSNPDLSARPQMLDGLVRYVRAFGR